MRTVRELVAELMALPPEAEIAVQGTLAQPRSIVVVRADGGAHPRGEYTKHGFERPQKAYLLRPERDVP